MERRDCSNRPREEPRSALPLPPLSPSLDPNAAAAVHEATRSLLRADSPRDVVDIVIDLVVALGARVVPARLAGPDELPLDLSFGVGEPLLARTEPAGVPRLHLETVLPTFVEDARQVVMTMRRNAELRDEAATDPLTGLLNRRTWDRRIHRLRTGDTVALLELAGFEALPTTGSPADDAVMAAFGPLLRDFLGHGDLAARYGTHRVAVGATGGSPQLLGLRLQRLRYVWEAVRPHPVEFFVGVAAVGTTAVQALDDAHEALAAAKLAGHGQTQVTV